MPATRTHQTPSASRTFARVQYSIHDPAAVRPSRRTRRRRMASLVAGDGGGAAAAADGAGGHR